MNYPTLEEVEEADRLQIAWWYRFLASPRTDEQVIIMNALVERFKKLRGMTPEISKKIGWKQPGGDS